MAYMSRIENVVWAFPGTPEETGPFTREDGLKGATHAPGGLFPGSKRTGIPSAAVQRRALELAELTGSTITMSRGEHYNPSMAGSSTTWFVCPAAHSPYRPSTQSGWLVTVSSPDGIIGYQHARYDFRTWPEVLAFLGEHFAA